MKYRKYTSAFKLKLGCMKCGYKKNDTSLDFHHVERKGFKVNTRAFFYGSPRTKDELKKCVLLCKNCHSELHAGIWTLEDFQIEPRNFYSYYLKYLEGVEK